MVESVPCAAPLESGPAARSASRAPLDLISLVAIALSSACAFWMGAIHSPTTDEPIHLRAGLRHFEGDFSANAGNPPLVDLVAALPARCAGLTAPEVPPGTSEIASAAALMANLGADGQPVVAAGRMACWPFFVLAAICCRAWAARLYGPRAGWLVCWLWCFNPLVLAHASVISGDVPSAAVSVAFLLALDRWRATRTLTQASLAGLLLGMAQLTKYVCLGLYPIAVAAWLVECWFARGAGRRRVAICGMAQLPLMIGISLLVLGAGYGFQGVLEPWQSVSFKSALLAPSAGLGRIPILLPRPYVAGLDAVLEVVEARQVGYCLGKLRTDGGWWFYPYGLAVKLPLSLFALAAVAALGRFGGRQGRIPMAVEMPLVLAVAVYFGLIAGTSGSLMQVRYIMPAVVFATVWLGCAARLLDCRWPLAHCVIRCAAAWTVISSVCVLPHALGYFNEAAGGPLNGHRHLVGSNLDWGQDLPSLRHWLRDNTQARPFHLAYYGTYDPAIWGIRYALVPMRSGLAEGPARFHDGPAPGWHAISASLLRGLPASAPDGEGRWRVVPSLAYEYFRDERPAARCGYSILVFHLSARDVARIRQRDGLPAAPQ